MRNKRLSFIRRERRGYREIKRGRRETKRIREIETEIGRKRLKAKDSMLIYSSNSADTMPT